MMLLLLFTKEKQKEFVIIHFLDDSITPSLLPSKHASSSLLSSRSPGSLHCQSLLFGFNFDIFTINTLISTYSALGSIRTRNTGAWTTKSLPTWNAIIVGVTMHGYGDFVMDYFQRMEKEGVCLDRIRGVLSDVAKRKGYSMRLRGFMESGKS